MKYRIEVQRRRWEYESAAVEVDAANVKDARRAALKKAGADVDLTWDNAGGDNGCDDLTVLEVEPTDA